MKTFDQFHSLTFKITSAKRDLKCEGGARFQNQHSTFIHSSVFGKLS